MAGAAFWSNKTAVMGDGLVRPGQAAPDQIYCKNPWDTFFYANEQFPGKCDIPSTSGVAMVELDNKKGKGSDGSRITITGYKPGQFPVTCIVWTSAQWDRLQELIDRIWTRPNGKTKLKQAAAEVRHPALQSVHVGQAALIGVSPPEAGPVEGTKIVRFLMQEYVEPGKKNTTKSPKAASVGVIPQFRLGQEPNNLTPKAPSTNKKNFSLSGPPAPPAGGL